MIEGRGQGKADGGKLIADSSWLIAHRKE